MTEDAKTALASIVTYSITEDVQGKLSNVILDIDVVCNSVKGTSSVELKPVIDTLHDAKNTVFFESLTDVTIQQFE